MDFNPYAQITKGTFLIATPDIDSGIFFRSVILICEHGSNGSFGLIVNKTLDLEVPEELLSAEQVKNPHISARAGGPVQTNQMMLLHNCDDIPHQTMKLCEGAFLGGDLTFLHEAAADVEGPKLYLCFGYAGWGSGQLEKEFLEGHWFIWPAQSRHVFDTPPEQLWQQLLREMGGKYATMSMIPEDLSLN